VKDKRAGKNEVADSETKPDKQDLYEELYRAHHARIFQLCRLWLNDSHEAEDAAQEVFLKLFRAKMAQEPSVAWRAWLTRVALNTCRDRRRSGWWKWWREKPVEFEEVPLSSPEPTPEEQTVSREAREHIWQLFRGLSVRQQEVFALRYVEEWSVNEVAQMLEITPGSVKQHLFRAVRHLRKALGGRR
jgi:RNA polymerase sigma-70 factor, ECF subfamily